DNAHSKSEIVQRTLEPIHPHSHSNLLLYVPIAASSIQYLLSKRNERIKACFPIALTVLIVRWKFYNLFRSVRIIRLVSLLTQRIFCWKCSERLNTELEFETPLKVIRRTVANVQNDERNCFSKV